MVGHLREVLHILHGGPFEGSFLRVMHGGPFEEIFFLRLRHGEPFEGSFTRNAWWALREKFFKRNA